jgi:transposase
LKPPEKQVINEEENVKCTGKFLVEAHSTWKGGRTYRKYSDEDKEYFFELVYEKGLRVSQAARKLGMPTRIAQGWYDKDQKDPQDIIQRKTAQNSVGRPPSLGEEHRIFLVDYIDKKSSLTLDEIMDDLSARFMDLSISKTAVYNFVKEKCRNSLKKVHFHSVERNSSENIKRRYE